MKSFLTTMLAITSLSLYSSELSSSPKLEDCKGSPASYYVSKLIEGGTIDGWIKATEMHQAYYEDRGFNVRIVPSIQYLPDDENNGPEDEIFRLSTHVIHPSRAEQEKFWEWNQNERTDSDLKARATFIAQYDKNNEVTARRYLCILSN